MAMIPQIGDFIACAKLAGQCIQALHASRGSKSEFTTLHGTLKAVSQAAFQAEAITMDFHVHEHKEARHVERLQAIAEEVSTQRLQIEGCIADFLRKVRAYTAVFEPEAGVAPAKARVAYKALTWLSRKDEVAFFEKTLNLQLNALQILLGRFYLTLMTSAAEGNRNLLTDGLGSVEIGISDVKFQMQEALLKLDMIWDRIPRDMPFAFGPEAIVLEDALGRQNLLPLMLTSTPEMFREVLLLMHKDSPGYEKIEHGKYVVSDEDRGGALIATEQWSETFRPGKRIGLSFLMKHPGSKNEKQCPRCMSMKTMTGVHPDERKCKTCTLRYKVEHQDRMRYFWKDLQQRPKPPPKSKSADSVPRDRKLSDPGSPKPKKKPAQRSSTLPPDEYMHPFRRVHYQRPMIRRISIDARWSAADPEFEAFLQALPPTHRAAASGDTATLDDLVADHEDINLDEGWKPAPGNELFRHDRTGWDWMGAPPIHFAVYFGHLDAVLFLLSNGADLEGRDAAGTTALHAAAWTGNEKLFSRLLRRGANVSARDYDGWDVGIYAMSQGHDGISRLLLKNSGAAESLVETYTLRHAAKLGNADGVLAMLAEAREADRSANDPEAEDKHLRRLAEALAGAAEGGHVELADNLLEVGADPSGVDASGSSALHWACWGGHAEIENMHYDELKDQELDDETVVGGRGTVAGSETVVGASVTAEIEEVDPFGAEPAEELVDEPIPQEPPRADSALDTVLPIRTASPTGDADDHPSPPPSDAELPSHVAVIGMLLEGRGGRRADVNMQNEEGCTALHWVAGAGSMGMVRFLLRVGADATLRDNMGRTPRDRAGETEDERMMAVLQAAEEGRMG